jgi:hypothetical protein
MALTKTTTIIEIDPWTEIIATGAFTGAVADVSDSFASLLYIELGPTEAVANSGSLVRVEVSYADDNWVRYQAFTSSSTTAVTTTLNGAVAVDDPTVTLTSATGNFTIPGQKFLIRDDSGVAIVESESCLVETESTNVVTLAQDVIRNHASGLNCYTDVDEWTVEIPVAAAKVRVFVSADDPDCNIAFTTRISKITSLT